MNLRQTCGGRELTEAVKTVCFASQDDGVAPYYGVMTYYCIPSILYYAIATKNESSTVLCTQIQPIGSAWPHTQLIWRLPYLVQPR